MLIRDHLERFFSKVHKLTDGSDCWEWQTAKTHQGYGRFSYLGKTILSHKWLYLYYHFYIPNGLILDHTCRNTSCVNLSHLDLVTHQENMLRSPTFMKTVHNRCVKTRKNLLPEGVYYNGEYYYISVRISREQSKRFGMFRTAQEASRAYQAARANKSLVPSMAKYKPRSSPFIEPSAEQKLLIREKYELDKHKLSSLGKENNVSRETIAKWIRQVGGTIRTRGNRE